MRAIQKPIDRSEHFVDATLLQEIGRSSPLQHALARKQPESRIVWRIDVGEFVDDELKFKQPSLCTRAWQHLPIAPKENGLRTNIENVCYVHGPHGCLFLDRRKASHNWIGGHFGVLWARQASDERSASNFLPTDAFPYFSMSR